jgi:hypothetical protein
MNMLDNCGKVKRMKTDLLISLITFVLKETCEDMCVTVRWDRNLLIFLCTFYRHISVVIQSFNPEETSEKAF